MTDTSVQPIDWNSFRISFNSLPFISDPTNSDPIEVGDILGFTGNGRFLVAIGTREGNVYAGVALTRALPGDGIVVSNSGMFFFESESDDIECGDAVQQGAANNTIAEWDGGSTIFGTALGNGNTGDFIPVRIPNSGFSGDSPNQNQVRFQVQLIGTVDGSNTLFSLPNQCDSSTQPAIYMAVGGASPFLRQISADLSGSPDYTYTAPDAIEFATAPVLNSILIADYVQE